MASPLLVTEKDMKVAGRPPAPLASSQARHTRSPVFVFTLVVGAVVAFGGWGFATMLEHGIVASSRDISTTQGDLPDWVSSGPALVATFGGAGGLLGATVWLLAERRYRRLALVYAAMVGGIAASLVAAELLTAVLQPTIRSAYENLPGHSPRLLPTDPVVAGLVAVVVLCRRWIPLRIRTTLVVALGVWLLSNFAIADAPPYLGIVLDVGLGMMAGSAVALVFGTPNLQPGREELIVGLSRSGLEVTDLRLAGVDARGSEPWLGATADGTKVFVKALSGDQRAADLLFRTVRWIRLRRTGDAAPEVSLKRSAEHEALVSHHVRSFGLSTPQVLAVATIGDDNVALVYEAVAGRSFDSVPVLRITDDVLAEVWRHVLVLRAHGVAHRDLRLANVFLGDDDSTLLIDFGFAELSAHEQLLDTDVAELLAATAAVVGHSRAVRVAISVVGVDILASARDWLHPLALSSATRSSLAGGESLNELRAEVARGTGHTISEYEPLGRLSLQRILGLGLLGLGVYAPFALVLVGEVGGEARDLNWGWAVLALAVSLLVIPLGAAAYRSATQRRVSVRAAMRALLASETPVSRPTYWSWANRVLSDAARAEGLNVDAARVAASRWSVAALLTSPVVCAGFATAAFRVDRGYLAGTALGLAAGGLVAAAELLLLRFGSSPRELDRLWLRPHHVMLQRGAGLFAEITWWSLIRTTQGLVLVFSAKSAGVTIGSAALVALAVAVYTVAALSPAPGDLGAVEVLLFVGLLTGTDAAAAGVTVIVTRTVSFWLHLPFAALAYRSTRRFKARGYA